MTLSEELAWRGFVNQTTYKDISVLDNGSISFYWGVDPSADSMTVGHFAMAMMVRHFINYGHKAYLLVGGATGMIGDPDGKKQERDLLTLEQIEHNKNSISDQYRRIFSGQDFEIVDNYDWFKDMGYLNFLRDIGKHAPMRQMLGRDFVQSRLSEDGAGISYAEFSYSLVQGYDFLHLFRSHGVTLQVCGADQWGNSVTGVDLIRRIEGAETHVWSAPLVINPVTGVKFGKTEDGAVWLDPSKTTPTQFYQFWINCDDAGVENYLKIFTLLSKEEIEIVMDEHRQSPKLRKAQIKLAESVTELVHGLEAMQSAQRTTHFLIGNMQIGEATESDLSEIRKEVPTIKVKMGEEVAEALAQTGLVASKGEGRRVRASGGVYINNEGVTTEHFSHDHFQNGRLLLRRGKAFKDSALVELEG